MLCVIYSVSSLELKYAIEILIAKFILGTGNSSVKTRLNMNLGTDKFEFKTSFPSRWDSRLTFPSVWIGKLDRKVRTGNSSAPGFILDEFPVSNMNSANDINNNYN